MSETKLVRAVVEFLRVKGFMAWRNNTGAMAGSHKGKRWFVRFGVPGMSDVFAIEPGTGRFVAVECKIGRNRPTADQRVFLECVAKQGGLAIVARNLDDVADGLAGSDNR